jgi:hypothetical protein
MQSGIEGDSILTLDGTPALRAIEDLVQRLMPVTVKEAIANSQEGDVS